MLTRNDLQQLSLTRQREARALLQAQFPRGAYYLAGYSVECALKACIAKRTRRFEFPDKSRVQKAHTHNLDALVDLAGLRTALDAEATSNGAFGVNWALARDWSEDSRYDLGVDMSEARDLYSACTAPLRGVLPWIRRRW